MKRTHFILSLFIVMGLVWQLIPKPDPNATTFDWFPFYSQSMAPQWYVYFTMEHLGVILLAWLTVGLTKGDRVAWWFLITQAGQLIDFWLTYNTEWFHIGTLPVTMNIVQAAIIGVVVLKEVYRDRADY